MTANFFISIDKELQGDWFICYPYKRTCLFFIIFYYTLIFSWCHTDGKLKKVTCTVGYNHKV